jgi:hypothetical protein
MSDLWTVTIERLHLVSKFDKAGNKISQAATKVPVTFNDLPYATALMYKEKAPDQTTITQQIHSVDRVRHSMRQRELPEPYSQAINREGIPPKHLGSEDIAHDVVAAAAAGDMGAAITAELEAAE